MVSALDSGSRGPGPTLAGRGGRGGGVLCSMFLAAYQVRENTVHLSSSLDKSQIQNVHFNSVFGDLFNEKNHKCLMYSSSSSPFAPVRGIGPIT